jgi:hypothetical protein
MYIFFSTLHGTFSKIDQSLGLKVSLSKYRKVEIILHVTDHNESKLDIKINN